MSGATGIGADAFRSGGEVYLASNLPIKNVRLNVGIIVGRRTWGTLDAVVPTTSRDVFWSADRPQQSAGDAIRRERDQYFEAGVIVPNKPSTSPLGPAVK
jgi:hypothetical protein